MEQNKIVALLEKYNYKYNLRGDKVVINLEFSQNVIIDLSDPSKAIISDYLENWNFLTGCFKMSLKKAVIYNFILLIFFGFFCQYATFVDYNLTNLLLTFISWILLFSMFYLIKLESFKLQFIAITK